MASGASGCTLPVPWCCRADSSKVPAAHPPNPPLRGIVGIVPHWAGGPARCATPPRQAPSSVLRQHSPPLRLTGTSAELAPVHALPSIAVGQIQASLPFRVQRPASPARIIPNAKRASSPGSPPQWPGLHNAESRSCSPPPTGWPEQSGSRPPSPPRELGGFSACDSAGPAKPPPPRPPALASSAAGFSQVGRFASDNTWTARPIAPELPEPLRAPKLIEFGGASGTSTVPLARQLNVAIGQAHIASPGVLSTTASSDQNQLDFRPAAIDVAGAPLVALDGVRELQWIHAENVLLRNDNATLRLEKSAGEVVMRKLRQTNSELRSQLEDLNLQISQLSYRITNIPSHALCPRLWAFDAQPPSRTLHTPLVCPTKAGPPVPSMAPQPLARDPDVSNEPAIAELRAAVAAAVPPTPCATAKAPPFTLGTDCILSGVNIIAESISTAQVCRLHRHAQAVTESTELWLAVSDDAVPRTGDDESGTSGSGLLIVSESPTDEAARLAQGAGIWQPVGPAEAAGGGCYLPDPSAARLNDGQCPADMRCAA